MKLKLDENLPESLLRELGSMGHDVDNVHLEGLAGRNDSDVWQAAQHAGRFFITQDLDFSDIRDFEPGTHHGLALVRLRLPGRRALAERITAIFAREPVDSWIGCFVVVTDLKLRVRRPSA